jgi:hypothetical protein
MGPASQHGSASGERTAGDDSRAGNHPTDAATQPLVMLGGSGGVLAAQLARFGELAGRDLSAGRPLTGAERQEMTTLRAAISGTAAQPYEPPRPPRPPRLRRRPSAGVGQSAGRHHRTGEASPGHAPWTVR